MFTGLMEERNESRGLIRDRNRNWKRRERRENGGVVDGFMISC